MKIRKEDTVLVVAGKDKGKKGKVRFSYPDDRRVIVEGVNIIKKHVKAVRDVRQAGIIEREAPIDMSNVMLLCTKCGKPTRVGTQLLQDGSKTRVCRVCHEVID
jgi:large subunit ribosomal protein L24